MKTDKQRFEEITLDKITPMLTDMQESAIANEYFAIILNGKSQGRLLLREGHIYHITGSRIILVLSGEIETTLDLEYQHWQKGDVILLTPDTIHEVERRSDDFDMIAINFDNSEVIEENSLLRTNMEEWEEILQMVHILWKLAKHIPFRRNAVQNLVSAIVNNVQDIIKCHQKEQTTAKSTKGELLFSRFKILVNKFCHIERNIPFYADRLFVSPHHLSSVIKKQSGKSVMYWINRATILKAKVMLKSGDLMTYEIAEKLSFPYHSTFTKFFKRETGVSPQEYRDKA